MRLLVAVAAALTVVACKDDEGRDKDTRPATEIRVDPGAATKKPTAPPPPGRQPESARPVEYQKVEGDGYVGWIAPPAADEHWTPTPEHIAALESRTAEDAAAAVAAGELPEGIHLSTYVRQYLGTSRGGEQSIGVQYICEANARLANKTFHVTGGGTCFVHAVYDMQADRLTGWSVNAGR